MPKAIIIGASSGIGAEIARQLSAEGYTLGLVARREALLEELKSELRNEAYLCKTDVSDTENTKKQFASLLEQMGGADLIIINAGIGFTNEDLDPDLEIQTINTNVTGFVLIADLAYQYFKKQGKGHIVGISSIAALRGYDQAPAYNASKAFVTNYMQGLRKKAVRDNLDITVTDIKPGFVDTVMAQGDNIFWVAPVPVAVKQMVDAIKAKKSYVYVTKRWRLIAWILKLLPDGIYNKI